MHLHDHIVLFSILGALGYIVMGSGVYFGSALHSKFKDDDLPFSVGFMGVIWPLVLFGWATLILIDAIAWIYNHLKGYPYGLRQRIIQYRMQRDEDREEEEADRQAQKERARRQREEYIKRCL